MAQVLPAQADTPRQLHYEQVPETKHERKSLSFRDHLYSVSDKLI